MTVSVCSSVSGEKFKPLVIWRYANPRCFRGIKKINYLQSIIQTKMLGWHQEYLKLEEVKPTNCNPTVWSNKEKESVNSFDDMIADMESNEKLSPVVTELLLRARKLNISFVFISQSYFEVPKMVGLNATHYFIMEIPNKRELQIFHLALILKISWKFINTIFIISE